MGCTHSNSAKAVHGRVHQYQLDSSLEESKGLKLAPRPLEPEEDLTLSENARQLFGDAQSLLSLRQFHNLFFDGFYAPYVSNPNYMLLLDTRDENAFLEKHVLAARWYGTLPGATHLIGNAALPDAAGDLNLEDLEKLEQELRKYTLVILYDQEGCKACTRSKAIHTPEVSPLMQLHRRMQQLVKVSALCLADGLEGVEQYLPYMISTSCSDVRVGTDIALIGSQPEKLWAMCWYPSIILEGTLWLGRAEQGANTLVLSSLKLTHLIVVGQTRPALAFPGMTCLTIPWTDSLKNAELNKAVQGAVALVQKAVNEKGRILVLGDQGVNRSATLVMASLMHLKHCTLEDAFYYVKSLRSAVQPSNPHLELLSQLEAELFGRKVTSVEDLW